VYTGVCWGNLRPIGRPRRRWEDRGNLRPIGRPRRRWEDNIKTGLQVGWRAWTGLIWLRTGTGDGHL